MTTNIKPLRDRVIVKRIDEGEQVRGRLIIPDSAKEKPQEGEVIAVGEGTYLKKTSDVAGDGTTTATVRAQAIFREGVKTVAAGANPMALKRGIDRAVEHATDAIKKLSKPVKGDAIAQVGSISANGDRTIGALIAEAMDKVGKDGVITVEESKTMETDLEFVEGMQFDRGYLSPYFVEKECAERNPNFGYNAATGTFEDLVAAGIIDPAKVTRCALQNAASIAGLMLTTEAFISEIQEDDKPGAMSGGACGRMGI